MVKAVECSDCGHRESEWQRYCPKCGGDMESTHEPTTPDSTKSDKM